MAPGETEIFLRMWLSSGPQTFLEHSERIWESRKVQAVSDV